VNGSNQRQVFEYEPTIGYRFIPHLKARLDNDVGGYLIRTNGAGFRCEHEFAEERNGARRILLFGDSFTAGDSVSNRDRYGDRLEKLLGVEVYNYGLSGTGTDQQYLIWHHYAKKVQHDLVLIGVLVENIRRVAARYRQAASGHVLAKPYFELDGDGRLQLHHVPVPKEPITEEALPADARAHVDRGGRFQWVREVANALGVKDSLQRLTRYQPLPAYDDPDSGDWRLLRAILKQWIDETRVPVVVCPIPLYQHVEETTSAGGYQARFAELAGWPRVHVVDPLPEFHKLPAATRRQMRFERDIHLTPMGHGVLAEALARALGPILA
jgi:carbamoyltransferase